MRNPAHWWRWWLGFGVLAIAGYFVMPFPDLTKNMYYNVLGCLSAVMIVVGARRHRPPRALMWYLLAAGQGLWSVGDFTYGILALVLHITTFPTVADISYLVAYPVLAAGLYIMIRGRTSGRDRAGLLDALIISTGVALPFWTVVMEPILHWDSPLLTRAVSLAYPAGDLLLIVMAARLFTAPGARTTSYRLLATALALLFGTDIVYLYLSNTSGYNGGAIDGGWLLSYVGWAAAALHPSMRSLSETAPDKATRVTVRRLAVLTTSSLVAPVILIWQGIVTPRHIQWMVIAGGAIVLFLLVLARMGGLIAQVQDQATQLDALAHNDALTGIPNRRAWDLELARRLAHARRSGQPVVVALLDLDHFKNFNDQYGHQAGDRLLKAAAAAWRSLLRDDDLLARYGGEEFGICATGLTAGAAAELLDRLQAATPLGQTFSAGIAVWTGEEAPAHVVKRADQALYLAKDQGRARAVRHPDDSGAAPTGDLTATIGGTGRRS